MTLRNAQGESLDYDYVSGARFPKYLTVFCHGLTGNKDRPLTVALAKGLAENGFSSLRFSFSGNGGSQGKFEDATPTKEVADLKAVAEAFPGRKLIIVGFSMGGVVAIRYAAEVAAPFGLVLLSSMIETRRFVEAEFGHLKPGASLIWDKPECPLSQAFVTDLRAIHSVAGLAPRLRLPVLAVHGACDDVIPIEEHRNFVASLTPPGTFHTVENASHLFAEPGATEKVVGLVTNWIETLITQPL